MLKCPNQGCDEQQHMLFNITIMVTASRDLTEDPADIEAEHFTCVNCGTEAIEVED